MSWAFSFGRAFPPPWAAAPLALLFLFALLFAAWPVDRLRYRILVFSARLLLCAALLTVYFRVSLVQGHRVLERRPLAILVDDSRSMTLPAGGKSSRWDQVVSLLSDGPTWDALSRDFDLRWFRFSDSAVPSSRDAIRSIAPEGKRTRLGETLDRFSSDPSWAGVLAVTDGVDTEGEDPDAAASGKERPIVALVPDAPANLTDVAILSIRSPEVAYFKSGVSVEIEVEAHGVRKDQVILRISLGERMLAEAPIPPEQWHGDMARVALKIRPDFLGRETLRVDATRLPEEVTFENNTAYFPLNVLRDRVRVLHVAGRATWDEKFLRDYLKESPNIDLISFFILRTPSNNPEASEQELSLIPFPYQDLFGKELNDFDLVILQNFDFKTFFPEFFLGNLETYVRNGGAVAVLGGELSLGRGAYRGTALERILPIGVRDDPEEVSPASFRPIVPPEGIRHPILGGLFRPEEIASLPALWGYQRAREVASDATVLLAHPTEKAGGRPAPVLAVHQLEKGRVACLTVDSIWRWAFSEAGSGPKAYRRLWDGISRWLLKDAGMDYIRLKSPEGFVEGRPGRLNVQTLDASYLGIKGVRPRVRVSQEGRPDAEMEASLSDSSGESYLDLPPLSRGPLSVEAHLAGREKSGYVARGSFTVEDASREFRRNGLDTGFLRRRAEASGGTVLPIRDFNPGSPSAFYRNARYELIGRKEYSLWDRPWLLVFALALACSEWWMRRRNGGT